MAREIEKIRNIGVIAHIDAGKTTTTECILYYSGMVHRPGYVDEGTTTTDSDPEEAERGITIYSAAVSCDWLGHHINLIDTPGHVDFTAEVERSLRVLDGGVVVFSAVEGVEAQSETVWRQSNKYRVPRVCFINKMDRIGASFERTLNAVTERLNASPLPVTVPMGEGPQNFIGVIDLISMQALTFDKESKGKEVFRGDIPEDYREYAEEWRRKLLDTISLLDDKVMMEYLETEDVSPDEIRRVIRKATIELHLQPLMCGSALHHIGIQPVLDAVVNYLPSPLDVPPVHGMHPNPKKQEEQQVRHCDPLEPLAGLIFKIVSEPHADFCFVRVYSGKLKSGSKVLNPRTGKKEMISQLWHIQSDRRTKVETEFVEAGDIVGVIGPKEVVTGDTLCDATKPVLLESITFPETVISVAVEPETNADRKKLADTLEKLGKQDPTFKWKISEETGQTIISGMGELHLEVIQHRMERDFNLKVKVHKPRVSYRETIRKTVERESTFEQKVGEKAQYARVKVRVEPFQTEKKEEPILVENKLKPSDLSPEWQKMLVQTVKDVANGGGYVGYPLMHIKLTLLDVHTREGETTETALQAATNRAVRQALDDAEAVLLEPVMNLEVVTPDDFLGNVQADLNSRRAIIFNSEHRGDLRVLKAEVPLSQMFGYSTQVRSISQGRASYSMEPLKYSEAPADVLEKMMF